MHELLILQVQYYPPAPKHEEIFESNVGRRETCLLALRVGLDRSRFPGSHVTLGAPARKEEFETALDGPTRTQSDEFLVFSRTGNPLVRTVLASAPLHTQDTDIGLGALV